MSTSEEMLVREWLASLSRESSASHSHPDALLHMYEFARARLLERDGFIPTHRGSRHGSVDSTINRDEVLRQVAEQLRMAKSESATWFVREWMDTSDDPNGILLDASNSSGSEAVLRTNFSSSTPTPANPVKSSCDLVGFESSSCSATAISSSTSLIELLDWDYDFLGHSVASLTRRSIDIFLEWGCLAETGTAKDKFQNFARAVSRSYKTDVSYHNYHHAVSVLAVSGNILRTCSPGVFSALEELSILVAAMCHDVGHKGLNSDFYIKTRHDLALQYNDISVLENMHCSLSFDLLRDARNDFTKSWTDEQYTLFRKIFIQSVLATDMKQHFEVTAKLVETTNAAPDIASNPEYKKNIYCAILHAADLANPTMPTKYCYDWAYRVVEEMYAQGKLEEQAGFTIAPYLKYPPSNIDEFAKLQLGFVSFIVSPLWKAMANMWPVLEEKLEIVRKNNAFWEALRDSDDPNALIQAELLK